MLSCFHAASFVLRPLQTSTVLSTLCVARCVALFLSQIVQTDIADSTSLDLVMEDDDNHGKCNVIFVGLVLSADQKVELQDYSRKFKVGGPQRNARSRMMEIRLQELYPGGALG